MQPPAQQHSPTSAAAADAIAPRAPSIRESVFAFIHRAGSRGATDEEIQTALALNPSTQRPRRIELVKAGRVYDSGNRRKTLANLDAVVWVAAPL